ncbi:MAG: o-succinylbenzoate synthase [Actinomycetota bacterium]|nr:o-succinylbenzoate synthase [Actinomycetota bacterium]
MELLAVELLRVELDLVRTIATSRGEHSRRPLVLVRVETDLGEGWGECEALAVPGYVAEHADGAERVLADHLVPRLLDAGRVFADARDALGELDAVRGHQMAKASLEMALLDAELRAEGVSLARRIGAVRTWVPAGATVGDGTPDEVLAEVARAVESGIERIKCKVAAGSGIGHVVAVRAAFPDVALAVDANGSFRAGCRADEDALRELDGLGLVAIEQPLAPDDLVGHAGLAAELDTPVVLDESVASEGDLESAIALRACDGVSLKAARLGGVLAAVAARDRCEEAGIATLAGGMLEAGLGRAASLAVAALRGVDMPGDLGPSERYFVPDLTPAHVLRDGRIAVPDAPGVGVAPLAEVLAATTVRRTTIRPTTGRGGRFLRSGAPA